MSLVQLYRYSKAFGSSSVPIPLAPSFSCLSHLYLVYAYQSSGNITEDFAIRNIDSM